MITLATTIANMMRANNFMCIDIAHLADIPSIDNDSDSDDVKSRDRT